MEVNFSNDSTSSMTPWGPIGVQLKAKEACRRGRSSWELLGNMSNLSHNFTLKLLTFAPHIKHCARSGTEIRRNTFQIIYLLKHYGKCTYHLFYYSTILQFAFQCLTPVTMKGIFFLNMTPCDMVEVYQRFERTCRLHSVTFQKVALFNFRFVHAVYIYICFPHNKQW
jgi:hypothetical protein